MSQSLNVYFSNRVEGLYERLKTLLFADRTKNPFLRRLIVVPSPAIKSWLMLRMAQDPDLKIACGITLIYLEEAVEFFKENPSPFPSQLELALAIEREIRKLLKEWNFLDLVEKSYWQPLLNYLKIKENLTSRHERRLIALSQKLAELFQKYGLYGGEMVKEWKTTPLNWQAKIWQKVYQKFNWSYPAQGLVLGKTCNVEVHLFSMSFLPKIYHDFFSQLATIVSTQFYLLSPCQAFWSDLCSDKEKNRLVNYWQKQGASSSQQIALEEYLRERNSLLANFGRIGREMAGYVEERDCLVEGDYLVSDSIQNHPHYEEFWFEELKVEKSALTFLKAIQADMTLLRTPDAAHKIEKGADSSIELHIAASKMREVEVIYHRLLGLIEKHENTSPISPSEIIVMAPHISDYEPFVKYVFGAAESQLDYQMMDLSLSFQEDLIKGFLHLLALPLGRRDSISFMQLLECSAFQKHHLFSESDVKQIREWTSKADIRWGYDLLDRQKILQKEHCENTEEYHSTKGTWIHGLNQLLEGLIRTSEPTEDRFSSFSHEKIEMVYAELLGRWIKIVKSLNSDLKVLEEENLFTLKEWETYLKALGEAYFGIKDSESDLFLIKVIESLRPSTLNFPTEKFPFSSLRKYLEDSLRQPQKTFRDSYLQTVRFCSLMPMRAIPAKVIVLMGMQEENFPRKEELSSLNLLQNNLRADYYPTQTDLDRYLFLEGILSAREYFLMSYVGYDESGKELKPSLVVSELLTYIENAFTSSAPIIKHPFYSFDKKYFLSGEKYKSYSLLDYKKALAFYSPEKKSISSFIENFSLQVNEREESLVINIQDITAFASNPLRTYFNKVLGIYLKEEEKEFKTEDDFLISLLDLARIKKMSLKTSLEDLLWVVKKEEIIPEGTFKNVSLEKLCEETQKIHFNLSKMGVHSSDIVQLHFTNYIAKPSEDEKKNWLLPPLKITSHLKVEGTLSEVSTKGLVVYLKDDKIDIFKAWPQFLLFCHAVDSYQLPFEKKLLFAKSGKIKEFPLREVEKSLEKYLKYFSLSSSHLSPLLPEWGYDFIYQSPERMVHIVQDHLNNPFKPIYNPYLKWMAREKAFLNIHAMSHTWGPLAKELFSEILENWYPYKVKGARDEAL